jgi:hypothetical protein
VNRKCVEHARKDLKNAHILASLPSNMYIKRDSAFVIPSSITSFSEHDAQAFLDLYTNLMKNSQMVAFFVQILDFCTKQ